MKNSLHKLAFLISGLIFINFSSAFANTIPAAIEVPNNVQQIIDQSCYACHNTASTDKKAKKKFDFDKLNFMKKDLAIAEWDKVATVVIEGEMPPKKFSKKYPDKQLSRNDKQVLTYWINGLSKETEISLESQMNELVKQIVSSLSQNQKSKIAVMEFVNMQGQITNLGRYLSEELTTRLYRTGKFGVIERNLLDKVVQEQKISLSGMIDETTAAELGRILGVDAIASGTITDLGTSVKVNARLISAETGELFSVASVEIPKNDKIKVLLSQTVATNTSSSATTSQTTSSQIIKKSDYTFELLETRLEGGTVFCKIKVTNTSGEDKDFIVINEGRKNNTYNYTMIYDDQGNEIKSPSIKTGNKLSNLATEGFAQKKILIKGSIIIELYFENGSPDVNQLSLLQIIYERYPGKVLEFRDIPLVKN